MDKSGHFPVIPKYYLILDRVLVKDVQYPSWWNVARTTARSLVQFLGLAYTCHCAKAVELFPPFFPMAHHETNLQRQSYVANLVYKKCSPQNYKGGGGPGGSKVGWVGPKLGGWVLSKIPTPPLLNEAWPSPVRSPDPPPPYPRPPICLPNAFCLSPAPRLTTKLATRSIIYVPVEGEEVNVKGHNQVDDIVDERLDAPDIPREEGEGGMTVEV